MPLQIIKQDITELECDAIVNSTNNGLIGRGNSVDGRIHWKAGFELQKACILLGGCETGKAKVTAGFSLPCKHIIHTVAPRWLGGEFKEREFLRSCYIESLNLAKQLDCTSVAFPLLASGTYGYPKDLACQVAMQEIKKFLEENDMLIYLVLYDEETLYIAEQTRVEVENYIEENYREIEIRQECAIFDEDDFETEIAETLKSKEETFSCMLNRKIEEKGIKNSVCYKRANVDKKLFSKIMSNINYQPKKETVLAFVIALELSMEEAEEMLERAGYAISHSRKADLIVEYFIKRKRYDIFEVNETLYNFGEPLLGSSVR